MRKLIVSEFVTLDGVIQAPGGKDEDRQGKHTVAIVALCTIAAMTVIFLSYPTYLYQRKNLEVSHEWQALGSWADHH